MRERASRTLIRVSKTSGIPVYKQVVDQVKFMIEADQLRDDDRLPSSRMLAANLGVNRNTVARAYAQLRDEGYLESRRRAGMVVAYADEARAKAQTRDQALRILRDAMDDCLRLGLPADEIASLAYHYGLQAEHLEVKVAFVECNSERAEYFAEEISRRLSMQVAPLVLGAFDPVEAFDVDLVLTTFFHSSEVRRLARGQHAEVVAIVAAPHVRTLVRLAQIPEGHRVGILYSTHEQAESIRDSLVQAGIHNVHVLSEDLGEELTEFDVVIVPTELPEMRERLNGVVEVIEFGNVLDESSLRMVERVADEIRDRKASIASGRSRATV
jgi:GntR family transcriptional regulator